MMEETKRSSEESGRTVFLCVSLLIWNLVGKTTVISCLKTIVTIFVLFFIR